MAAPGAFLQALQETAALKAMLREHLAYVDEMQRDAEKEVRWVDADPAWAYAKIALNWSERYYRAERQLTLLALAMLSMRTASKALVFLSGFTSPSLRI